MILAARSSFIEHKNIPYVTDGLVAWWDGIWNAGLGKHDANATVWKDLVSGADVSWTGPTFDQSTWHWMTDGFDFSTTDAQYRLFKRSSMPSALVDAFNSGTYSLECVFERSALRNSGIAYFQSNAGGLLVATATMSSSIQIYSKNNTWTWGGVSDAEYPANAFGVRSSLTGMWTGPGIGGSIYKDGTFVKTYTDPVVLTDSKYTATANSIIAIGGYASTGLQTSGRNQLGKIYSIRLYNRALTAAEIAANYAADKERFNLP